ncbi:MAG: ABC transporter permease [Anaerolineae bacterium]|nr:MAG: ABC transporter permease [Anaerolineae bacterium]
MQALKSAFRQLAGYPSAMIGMILILILIGVGIYAPIAIPYDEAITMWRGGEEYWRQNPRTVPPVWYNWFIENDLPESFDYYSDNTEVATRTDVPREGGGTQSTITYTFDFQADQFPQELIVYMKATFATKKPFVSMLWITPDGREIRVVDVGISQTETYRFGQDTRLTRRIGGLPANQGLFADPNSEELKPLKGIYKLVVDVRTFEEGDTFTSSEFVMHGLVSGWFGTDHFRRDLGIAMLWGTPVALAFGTLASLGTSVITMIIAAIGVWYGSWLDELIQRITEVNLVLPFLNILIMVGVFYSRSIWTMLGVTILLSIFGAAIKTYRAIFLQVRESPYIEAARAYGASSMRIVFQYLIPRIIPLLIPGLVLGIPTFVFLEATLAVLGLGDPTLPTWGKMINDANNNAALYNGFYYWILQPAALLMFTGLAFAMVGFAMDRVFNPRLRGV